MGRVSVFVLLLMLMTLGAQRPEERQGPVRANQPPVPQRSGLPGRQGGEFLEAQRLQAGAFLEFGQNTPQWVKDKRQEQMILYGAKNVNPAMYRSTVFTVANKPCSATLVGPSVALTADHCLLKDHPQPPATLQLMNGTSVNVTCWRLHHEWDLAACLMQGQPTAPKLDDFASRVVARETFGLTSVPLVPLPYESTLADDSYMKVGREVVMAGFGLSQKSKSPLPVGSLSTGVVKIVTLPTDEVPVFRVSWDLSGPVAASADSGGAVYVVREADQRRWIAGVIIAEHEEPRVSFIVSLVTPSVRALLSQWSKDRGGALICGLTGECEH